MAVTEQLAEQRRRTEADQHTASHSAENAHTDRATRMRWLVARDSCASRRLDVSSTLVVPIEHRPASRNGIIVIYSYFMTRPKEVERDVASHLKRASKVATGGMGALACCDLLIVVQALRKYSAALANRDST